MTTNHQDGEHQQSEPQPQPPLPQDSRAPPQPYHPTFETNPRWTAVDTYTFTHLHPSSSSFTIPSNTTLSHILSSSAAAGLPDIAVSPSQGKYLQLSARAARARHILEIGTLGGYSTVWLATAGEEVHVVSIEVDEGRAGVARRNLEYAGVSDRVDVIVGDASLVLQNLFEEIEGGKKEKFDFVFIDADKLSSWAYLDTALDMCRSGAQVVVDNVVWKGQIVDEEGSRGQEEEEKVRGARRVVENVGRDKRVDAVVVQVVGEKNYDGFLVGIVR